MFINLYLDSEKTGLSEVIQLTQVPAAPEDQQDAPNPEVYEAKSREKRARK